MHKNENKYEKILELDKILNMLSSEASTDDAKTRIFNIKPCYSSNKAKKLLKETDDAFILINRFKIPPFSGIKNIEKLVLKAKNDAVLSMSELLKIGKTLKAFREIKNWKKNSENVKTSLDWRFNEILPNKHLEDRINNSIISDQELADNASTELLNIRRKIKISSCRIKESLEKIINSPTYQKYLQDFVVTMRQGRFVIPVKAEYKNEINGLLHDISSSGATVFIEPVSVVQINNDIKALRSKEQDEIEKILWELSSDVAMCSEDITASYNSVIDIDIIFAKASLACKMKAFVPKINESGFVYLKDAKHPLISSENVVPLNVILGKDFDTLVITGPNTGGKTVALKTIGLFILMAMCGLMIPASEESNICIFDKVLADIGDEQSIEQSLSTFSSHMKNIIDILNKADSQSLILLDELGAGTDPIEGAAIAMSILEALREKGSKIVATTHYAELKEYAIKTKNVENACCEFDVKTLHPTYKLLIGVPGSSNAFEISRLLGINDKIILRAKEFISSDKNKFEDVVKKLENDRKKLENKQKEIENLKNEIETIRNNENIKRKEAEKEIKKQINAAKETAISILNNTKRQADELFNELETIKNKKELSYEDKIKLKGKINLLEKTADPVDNKKNNNYKLPRKLKVGDTVLIFDIDKKATVLKEEDKSGNVFVQAGIIKTRVPISNLRLIKEEYKIKSGSVKRVNIGIKDRDIKLELDLRGKTALESIIEIDGFIDNAVLSGVKQLTVIHGKGTGVLRKEIHKHLKCHPCVDKFRLGTFGEGESGVTIVSLK